MTTRVRNDWEDGARIRLGIAAVAALGIAAAVVYGYTQPWSFDDWWLVDWFVVLGGGGLTWYVFNRLSILDDEPVSVDRLHPKWKYEPVLSRWVLWAAAIPTLLYVAGTFFFHWRAAIWSLVDLVAVVLFGVVGLVLGRYALAKRQGGES
jgi:hypothetical protein